MNRKLKDRVVDWALILLFLTIVSGCAYFIIKTMTKWTIPGLG